MTIELGSKGIPLGSYEEGSGGEGGIAVDSYTKEETDLLLEEKQDKLNVSAPIQFTKISSVPDNISVASDGETMYLNYSSYTVPYVGTNTFRFVGGSPAGKYDLSKCTRINNSATVLKDGKHGKAIQINLGGYFHYLHNFKIGDVVKFTFNIPCVIGHLDSDNYFEPYIILNYSNDNQVQGWALMHTNVNGYSVSGDRFDFSGNRINVGSGYGYQASAFSNQCIRFEETDAGKIKIQTYAYKTHTNGDGFYPWQSVSLDDTYDAASLNCILFGNEPWSYSWEPSVSSLSSINRIKPNTQSIFYAATFNDVENPKAIVVPGDIAELETLNLAIDTETLSIVDNKLTVIGGGSAEDLEEQVEDLGTQVGTLSTQVSSVNSQVTTLSTQVASVNTQVAELEDQMGDIEAVLDAINGGVAPAVTFSYGSGLKKAGSTESDSTLTFTDDLGNVSFGVTSSVTLNE